MRETDLTLPDGGILHAYDTGAIGERELVVAAFRSGLVRPGR